MPRCVTREPTVSPARVGLAVGVEIERRRFETFGRPGVGIAPRIVSHGEVTYGPEWFDLRGRVLFQIVIKPIDLNRSNVERRLRAELDFGHF